MSRCSTPPPAHSARWWRIAALRSCRSTGGTRWRLSNSRPACGCNRGADAQSEYASVDQPRKNFSANGGIADANEELVDGAPVSTARAFGIGWQPPVDATEEFKVETNNYSAEYGRSSGAVVNLSLPSGTNHLHRHALRVLPQQRSGLQPVFPEQGGTSQAAAKVQPIWRLGRRTHQARQDVLFRECRTIRSAPGVHLDHHRAHRAPARRELLANLQRRRPARPGGRSIHHRPEPPPALTRATCFTRNCRMAGRLDNVAQKFQQIFWPLPNAPGAAFTGVNNFSAFASQPIDARQGIGKIDHTINAKWKLFASYAQDRIDRGALDYLHNKIAADQNGFVEGDTSHNAILAATAIFSPRWIGQGCSLVFRRCSRIAVRTAYRSDLDTGSACRRLFNKEGSWPKPRPDLLTVAGICSPCPPEPRQHDYRQHQQL